MRKSNHNFFLKLAKRSKIFFLVYMYQNELTVTSLKPKYFSSGSSSSSTKKADTREYFIVTASKLP